MSCGRGVMLEPCASAWWELVVATDSGWMKLFFGELCARGASPAREEKSVGICEAINLLVEGTIYRAVDGSSCCADAADGVDCDFKLVEFLTVRCG